MNSASINSSFLDKRTKAKTTAQQLTHKHTSIPRYRLNLKDVKYGYGFN